MTFINPNPPGISRPAKHAYVRGCDCKRCTREWERRSVQSAESAASAIFQRPIKVPRLKPRIASRAEQHARYIDCGPGAWDDRS